MDEEAKSSGAPDAADQGRASKEGRTDIGGAGKAGSSNEAELSEEEDALDIESMDLTIETVEERISPSETNVFDK